jgi:acyl-coenzyme A synthetase/AMP-(fatty) acid ligase
MQDEPLLTPDFQELIKVNGLQVAPAELEAVLLENEHVADAAVVEIKLYATPKRQIEKP